MKVKVTEYEGNVVIETFNPDEKYENFSRPYSIGCTLTDTKNDLGISKEAWTIIKNMKKSDEKNTGEIMATRFESFCRFSWLGSPYRRINPNLYEVAYEGIDDIDFVEIPNETSPYIIKKIREVDNK